MEELDKSKHENNKYNSKEVNRINKTIKNDDRYQYNKINFKHEYEQDENEEIKVKIKKDSNNYNEINSYKFNEKPKENSDNNKELDSNIKVCHINFQKKNKMKDVCSMLNIASTYWSKKFCLSNTTINDN